MNRNERGFTLMELMVVIVIVAILAAVAVPLYVNYVRDARRTEAKGAIGAIITAEQTYYQTNTTYSSDTTQVKFDVSDVGDKWLFTIPAATATTFSVHAEGKTPDTAGLWVQVDYERGKDPVWTEH